MSDRGINTPRKVIKIQTSDIELSGYYIYCPGCKCGHLFDRRWTFNGDYDKPTFSPSMLVNANNPNLRCHSFVENGKIRFLSDCFHEYANQTLDLEDVD